MTNPQFLSDGGQDMSSTAVASGQRVADVRPDEEVSDGLHDGAPPHKAGHRNEVVLVGRLPAEPYDRTLPSGDTITIFRLVVQRSSGRENESPRRSRAPTVDTLSCVSWSEATRHAVSRLRPADIVQVRGALRRRFWRGPDGLMSRYEIEVADAVLLARPPEPTG